MIFDDSVARAHVNAVYPGVMVASQEGDHHDHIHVRWCVVYYPPGTTPSYYPPNDWGWYDC